MPKPNLDLLKKTIALAGSHVKKLSSDGQILRKRNPLMTSGQFSSSTDKSYVSVAGRLTSSQIATLPKRAERIVDITNYTAQAKIKAGN